MAFIIDAVRTPFGRHRGGLAGVRADDLAAAPLIELLNRYPGVEVDDVVLGNANGAGEDNRNVARMAALLAGLPVSVPGVTVNRLCASGAEAVMQASRAIDTGDASLILAGGVESMTRAPFVLPKPDVPFPAEAKLWNTQLGWRMVNPKFSPEWTVPLGAAAEKVALEKGIGRQAQDEWSLRSHQLASKAPREGIFPFEGLESDECIRPDASLEKLAALKPAFTKDGTVTAGNSSPINDGAIAVLVGSQSTLDDLGVEPLGRIVAGAVAGVSPDRFSLGPVPAIHAALRKASLSVEDIALWEINEAFAAMVLSCLDELPIPHDKVNDRVNVNGGAIAIGHPLGASAPRVIVDLCRELRRRGGGYGVAAACIGVGQGQAVVVRVG